MVVVIKFGLSISFHLLAEEKAKIIINKENQISELKR